MPRHLRKLRPMLAAGVLGALLAAAPAQAIPTLQLYIEGATYDAVTETWTFTGDDFTLWVLGDVAGYGPIYDVKLTAAFPSSETGGTISILGYTATSGLLPSPPGDPSVPSDPTVVGSPSSAATPSSPCVDTPTTDGRIPCLGNGKVLPTHSEYGPGTQWIEYALGDLTLTDSPIGDYSTTVPAVFPSLGQINAYDISVSGFTEGTLIHWDAFNHIVHNNSKWKHVFVPFSHDALDQPPGGGGGGGSVPAPASLVLLGLGLLGLEGMRRVRRRD